VAIISFSATCPSTIFVSLYLFLYSYLSVTLKNKSKEIENIQKRTIGSDGVRENKISISLKENKRNASKIFVDKQSHGSWRLALLCAADSAQGRGKWPVLGPQS
jgi:hypothetical protein